MSNFPTLLDGQPVRQTVKKSLRIPVSIFTFVSGKEQRYVDGTPTYSFNAQYPDIYASEYKGGGVAHSIGDFYDAMKGTFGVYNLTLAGKLYSNLYFDGNGQITFDEKAVNVYGTTINIKGFQSDAFPTITVSDPVLPTLGNGTTGPQNQYPNQLTHRFSNSVVDVNDTQRLVYARWASPIPGGVLTFQAITDAEAAIFEAFYLQLGGAYGIFTLAYNGVSYTNCRFSSQSLDRDFSGGPNVNRFNLSWEAIPH